jgi:hypothetical protein
LAEPAEITKKITIPKYGLDNLIKVTLDSFPQQAQKARATAEEIAAAAARRAFIAAQKIDVDLKIAEGKKYLNAYVAGSAAAGSPLSGFFGGVAVAGVQTAMIAHLTRICGL